MLSEPIEELLELCWTAGEDGLIPLDRDHLPAQLLCFLPHPIADDHEDQQVTIDAMIRQGLVVAEGRRIRLSPAGETHAQLIARRHRLTEVLLGNVLAVSEESMESTACQVEHILNTEVTDAVCAFLGHPPACPHGRLIPRGACCAAAVSVVEPLIVPLARLALGEEAVLVFIHTARHAYLQRLQTFGLVPGVRLTLRQRRPTVVVQVGEAELALDEQAGTELFVRRQVTRSYVPVAPAALPRA